MIDAELISRVCPSGLDLRPTNTQHRVDARFRLYNHGNIEQPSKSIANQLTESKPTPPGANGCTIVTVERSPGISWFLAGAVVMSTQVTVMNARTVGWDKASDERIAGEEFKHSQTSYAGLKRRVLFNYDKNLPWSDGSDLLGKLEVAPA